MAPASPQPGQPERRRWPRTRTRRPAVFCRRDAGALLRSGTATDLSLNGLCIHTRTPEPAGSQLDIEMNPDAKGGEPILVRGRVARLEHLGGGEWAVGIHLRLQPGPAATGLAASAHETAQALIERITGQLRTPAADAAATAAYVRALGDGGSHAVLYRPAAGAASESRRPRRTLLVLILLVLLMLGGGSALYVMWQQAGVPDADLGAESVAAQTDPVFPPGVGGTTGEPVSEAATPAAVAPAGLIDTDGVEDMLPAELLAAAQARLAEGQPEAAAGLFAALAQSPGPDGPHRFLAQFGAAQAYAALGRHREALDALCAAAPFRELAAEPWLDAAEAFRTALLDNDVDAAVSAMLRDTAALERVGAGGAPADSPEGGVRIAISTRDYLLTVYRAGVAVMQYPVGLGEAGSTPEGDFVVTNKLVQPDWYDHGRRVPSGDPENPLGSRWMGLGDQDGPTPYGIHPTSDAGAIGANRSRGCIRMRAADAEALFELCDVGTPVRIEP